jgi:hypothetical protein
MRSILKKIAPHWFLFTLVRIRGLLGGKWPLAMAERTLSKAAGSQSLTGKILLKMAYDRNPIQTTFADKLMVREYVQDRVGQKYLNTLIACGDSTEFLKSVVLPPNFALKSNNGSGGMILVWEKAPKENLLPKDSKNVWAQYLIKPELFKLEEVERFAKQWLSSNYFYRPGRFPEWAYKDIPPMLMVEELMIDAAGQLPSDYKFFMIGGNCEFIQVDTSRFDGHKRTLFTPKWERINGTFLYPASADQIAKPKFLQEMLVVAQKLSADVDFVRVDLYETSIGVKFGELTNYPEGGAGKFNPATLDLKLGAAWDPKY